MADLRQILSQGQKRIGLLVGAGAPLAMKVDQRSNRVSTDGKPSIPGISELTDKVLLQLSDAEAAAAARVRGLLGKEANIETLLSAIRLRERVAGTMSFDGLSGAEYGALAKKICDEIGSLVSIDLPEGANPFSQLVSWISGTFRAHAVEIFTTNYDLLFEQAFERAKVSYFDGFSGGGSSFFDAVSVASDDLPSRWVRLWKLHGSLGWSTVNGNVIRRGDRSFTDLIYPDHLKYDLTKKQPYTALFEHLKAFLLQADTLLLTIGFSFNDAHVCSAIDESLAINPNAAAFAFQYQPLAGEAACAKLALDRPNLSLYASDGAIIRGVPGSWVPGQLPNRQWQEIRASFWGKRQPAEPSTFLLGDFNLFSRFCSLAQATDIVRDESADVDSKPITGQSDAATEKQ